MQSYSKLKNDLTIPDEDHQAESTIIIARVGSMLFSTLEEDYPWLKQKNEVSTKFSEIVADCREKMAIKKDRVIKDSDIPTTTQQVRNSSAYKNCIKQLKAEKELEYKSENIVLYKSKKDELAVKFPGRKVLDKFITQLNLTSEESKQLGLAVFKDNPNTLYLKAEIKNGHLQVEFPNAAICKNFINALKVMNSNLIDEKAVAEASLRLLDQSILEPLASLSIPIPREIAHCNREETITAFFKPKTGWTIQLEQIIKDYDHSCNDKAIDCSEDSTIEPSKKDKGCSIM